MKFHVPFDYTTIKLMMIAAFLEKIKKKCNLGHYSLLTLDFFY